MPFTTLPLQSQMLPPADHCQAPLVPDLIAISGRNSGWETIFCLLMDEHLQRHPSWTPRISEALQILVQWLSIHHTINVHGMRKRCFTAVSATLYLSSLCFIMEQRPDVSKSEAHTSCNRLAGVAAVEQAIGVVDHTAASHTHR